MTTTAASPGFARVAVLGLGTVGSALAGALARAGVPVVAVETDEASLARGAERTARVAGDRASAAPVTYTTRLEAVADSGLVIEAVPEDFALKADLLRRAADLCGADTVFATTTSLPVTRIAAACGRLPRTVGLHPVGHAPEGGCVEVVHTPVTDPAVRTAVEDLVRRTGRTPVAVSDQPGFVGGGLLLAYLNGAIAMFERRYASRDDIDAAMRLGCGLPLGPLAHADLIGLDTIRDGLRGLYELTGESRYLAPPLLGHMVTAGLLGVKSGRGFYRYPQEAPARLAAAAPAVARPVRSVGVIGSGTMAKGIAEVFARSGRRTVLVARTEVRAKEALDGVARSLDRGVHRGKIGTADRDAAVERLTGTQDMAAVAECDLVVEAVAEELAVKRAVFRRLDRVCRPGAVLTTSTSSLPVVECAVVTSRPESVLGMHFFNPAPVMRLVEVVGTVLTSEEALGTVRAVCADLGKHPVSCGDRAGFIVNALLFPYLNGAVRLLEQHRASAEDIDTVMTAGCAYPLGPLALLDVIGLDVSLQIQETLHRAFQEPTLEPARHLRHLVAAGYLGRKSGRGFRAH
ncbi:3-hydroxyacyl-CoA dehydrogenase family protein [Streptomyces sp. H51]|uniref:3-hydroxyacyl-CoA dehydrogenase family protein n=1 Tax=Streptomyces sp. H51 TaxID=3111770 RepID=UPI003B63B04A